ncbi:MAG: phosphatidylglycerophosphatase A [Desulfatitalea sp.]|nr:phosphatidylglycerophosphatase A [Desulfatitalea sp.]
MAPGTLGSLIGLPIAYGLAHVGWPSAALLTVLLILASVPITTQAARMLKANDPGGIVLDEIAGMVVALHGIAFSAGTAIAGFVLFRIFDISKLPPVGIAERRLRDGWGIVMDDVIAGVMANVVLRLGIYLLNRT